MGAECIDDEDWDNFETDGDYLDDEELFCVECGEPACGGGVCSVCFQPMCDGCIEMCCGVCNQHDENGKPLVLADVDDPLTDSVPVEDGTWQCKHPDGSSTTLHEGDTAGWERVVCPDCGAHWVVWDNVVAGQRQAIPVIVPVYEEEANDE